MTGVSTAKASRTTMARLVATFLEHLEAGQRATACWPFADEERRNWHYVPRVRQGVPIEAMGPDARAALHELLRFTLSEAGYRKATDIFRIEGILGEIEQHRRHRRHPDNYSVTVFGEPGQLPWGWRIEGHHLSLNFAAITETLTAVHPSFFGANPARVPDGYELAGHRTLARETDLSFALIQGLSEDLQARAMIAAEAPADIITGPGREQALATPQGLALGAMPAGDRNLALELVATFAGNLRAPLAEVELARIREAGVDQLHLAWAGALAPGAPNYWRLHGPITLIEYDNTQNAANHVHTVWHDRVRNFGEDLLRRHYQHKEH